ncbi:NAD(P)-dependent oxidoreductase|uniref:L-threonate dehydrogenase n=1 Tax=Noviherbaspirillum sp. L7-7A TaxID=2850560 RepID=UPI001C2CB81A|nr:L-threonate dehydrogenase [Noviherbaspirillum sp. L7-7A]MBV0878049.1 NAD(P)-dependent oxidoreductase [Noviherbaspirillum sp. L7-7A]
MADQISRVGLVGLGAMGMGIGKSLLRAGLEVHACDVRPEAVQSLADAGAHAAASPAELAARVDALIIVVVNAQQTEAVLFGEQGAAAALAPGAVVIACATVAPEFAEALGARLVAMGLRFIDAPVSGGAAKAAAGEMSVMAAGAPEAFARCERIFDAIAGKLYRLGEQPGQGSKVKMINQLLAGVHIAAAAEAMALGLRAGCDPDALYEVISNSAGSSWMFQNRVPHILAGDYTPLSAVNIFVKDLGIVLDYAKKTVFPLPLSSTAHQMFMQASAAGHGGEDDSAVIKLFPGITLPAARKAGQPAEGDGK